MKIGKQVKLKPFFILFTTALFMLLSGCLGIKNWFNPKTLNPPGKNDTLLIIPYSHSSPGELPGKRQRPISVHYLLYLQNESGKRFSIAINQNLEKYQYVYQFSPGRYSVTQLIVERGGRKAKITLLENVDLQIKGGTAIIAPFKMHFIYERVENTPSKTQITYPVTRLELLNEEERLGIHDNLMATEKNYPLWEAEY